MAYNGSGVYTLPGAALVNGEIVSATENNQSRNDFATALNVAWTRDGQAPATGNIPMGNHKFTGMNVGTTGTDSITLGQTQGGAYAYLTAVSGTNTITATITPSFAAYTQGQTFRFVASGENTTASTLNINSLGAKDICKGILGSASGTYSVSGSTTIAITAANDFETGQEVYLDFTLSSGTTLNDGKFTIVTASATDFTVTYGSTVSSTGTVTAVRNAYLTAGNIAKGSLVTVVYDGVRFQLSSGIGGASIVNDITTDTEYFPLMANASSGTANNVYTSDDKLTYNPESGTLKVPVFSASTPFFVNALTVSDDYSIPASSSAMSTGPITIADGKTVTIPDGCRWVIL